MKQTMEVLDNSMAVDLASELEALEVEEKSLRLRVAIADKRWEVEKLKSSLQTPKTNSTTCSTIHMQRASTGYDPQMETIIDKPNAEEELVTAKSLKNWYKEGKDTRCIDNEMLDLLLAAENGKAQGYQHTEGKSSKTLFIRDFVKAHNKIMDYEEEEDLLSSKLGTLTLRSTRKPQTENVTINQWIAANARLMIALIKRGDLSTDKITSYLEYTAQIGEYFDLYDREKVLVYDHDVRERVAAGAQSWETPYIHGVLCMKSESVNQGYAYKKPFGPKVPYKKPQGADSTYLPVVKDNNGRNICRDFQTEHGCRRYMCKFSHVCIVESCKKSHPQHLHSAICKD
jgi:hypothetical protein